MALALKFGIELSSDGATLTVIDRTGIYSGTNLGGFGSPNPATTDATTATFKIAKRNSDGTFGDDVSVNVYSTFPSSISGEFDIDADDGVDADTYEDAIYRFTYTVISTSSGTPFSVSTVRYDTLRNSIAFCYQEKSLKIADCNCSCSDIEESFKCFSLYYRLLLAAECEGDLNKIQKYLDKLTELCSSGDCNCT